MKLGILPVVLITTLLVHYPKQHYCDQKFRVCTRLTIAPDHLCLSRPGALLNITCRLLCGEGVRNGSMDHENWTLVWYHDGKTLVNTVSSRGSAGEFVSRITVDSIGMFTCVSTNQESPWHSQNRSVNVKTVPKPVEKLDQKPTYTATGKFFHEHVVKISWRCSNPTEKRDYRLVYWHTTEPVSEQSSDAFTCASAICTTFFVTNQVDSDYDYFNNVSFYIVTRSGECEAKSKVWTFFVTKKRDDGEGNLVVFLPPPPDRLYITTAFRKVTMTWDNREARYNIYAGYSYHYNNSMESSKVKNIEIHDDVKTRRIELTEKDILHYTPYQEFTFCLQLQWFDAGDYSKPRCNTTRLHEEIPSEAPTITCSSETCPTTDDGDKRSVMITWDLPSEETWNGVLTELKVLYYSSAELESEQETEISVRNMSSRSVALTELNSTQRYMVSMRACTQEGCSKTGNNLQIFVRSKKASSSGDIFLILGCSVAAVIIIIALCIFVWWSRRRYHQCYPVTNSNEAQLPELDDPGFHMYQYPTPESFQRLDTGTDTNEKDINANNALIVNA